MCLQLIGHGGITQPPRLHKILVRKTAALLAKGVKDQISGLGNSQAARNLKAKCQHGTTE